MKTIVILDSETNSTHPMEEVMERRGYIVFRCTTVQEVIAICQNKATLVDLAIADVPLAGSESQTEAAVQIRRACPELPLLLVSNLPLERWAEEDFRQFEKLLPGRIDLLQKPLSERSFIGKANAMLYTISYLDSRKLFDAAASHRILPAKAS
ncbi:MAG: hypothetical protein ABUS51_09760 [Acidobacteriota bacterium]